MLVHQAMKENPPSKIADDPILAIFVFANGRARSVSDLAAAEKTHLLLLCVLLVVWLFGAAAAAAQFRSGHLQGRSIGFAIAVLSLFLLGVLAQLGISRLARKHRLARERSA
jgi:hypothetical protein